MSDLKLENHARKLQGLIFVPLILTYFLDILGLILGLFLVGLVVLLKNRNLVLSKSNKEIFLYIVINISTVVVCLSLIRDINILYLFIVFPIAYCLYLVKFYRHAKR